jgi:hypothetical protein
VPKDTHHTTIDGGQLELPEQGRSRSPSLPASPVRLLALAVGTGLQVLQVMLAEDVAWLVGPRAATSRSGPRCAMAASRAR